MEHKTTLIPRSRSFQLTPWVSSVKRVHFSLRVVGLKFHLILKQSLSTNNDQTPTKPWIGTESMTHAAKQIYARRSSTSTKWDWLRNRSLLRDENRFVSLCRLMDLPQHWAANKCYITGMNIALSGFPSALRPWQSASAAADCGVCKTTECCYKQKWMTLVYTRWQQIICSSESSHQLVDVASCVRTDGRTVDSLCSSARDSESKLHVVFFNSQREWRLFLSRWFFRGLGLVGPVTSWTINRTAAPARRRDLPDLLDRGRKVLQVRNNLSVLLDIINYIIQSQIHCKVLQVRNNLSV